MIRMSKKLYVGALIATFVMLFLFGLPAIYLLDSYRIPRSLGIDDSLTTFMVGLLIFLAVAPFLIAQAVVTFLVIYRMWASIQDGYARTSPGKAVGFLFIPFFNLYWIFQVWGGFPKDYNRYVDRYRLQIPHLSAGLYVAYPLLILLSIIPFVGILCTIINFFMLIAIAAKTCDAVNALAGKQQESLPLSMQPSVSY